jgi:CHAT domain-containing protein
LATRESDLREAIESLRRLQSEPRSDREALRSLSRRLYDLLIAPAESALLGGTRLVIAPDGPLHSLPFAALIRPDGRYLLEWRPLHFVISAPVYAELKNRRREKPEGETLRVAAFGDPDYPPSAGSNSEKVENPGLRSWLRRGLRLTPLPATRREVEAIRRVFPQTEVFVGQAASEERVKTLPSNTSIVHFAGHALLDDRPPFESSLALSIPESPRRGEEDGFLHSWEILERLRWNTDLVTLSACGTALGKDMGGEGLVGLSRAFLLAGARTVLASLWAIGDRSTARFMPRFYELLRSGLSKDEALRRTQIEWLRDPKSSHPFHWAAFELIGDYR